MYHNENGVGLIDALVAMVLILLTAMAIFGGITFFDQMNTKSAISITAIQKDMSEWALPQGSTTVTAPTRSYYVSVNVNYTAATSSTQSESVPVALAESGAESGWTKVATE
jgi:hypothetical protein